MATLVSPCPEPDCCAADVARSLARFFHHRGLAALCEVPLPNGRRADMVLIDAKGTITIIEIKVARGDLIADTKWPEYLDWCDHFYWALTPSLGHDVLQDRQPERCGLIVADRYDAAVIRESVEHRLASARRRSELLRIGRLAMRRLSFAADPMFASTAGAAEAAL